MQETWVWSLGWEDCLEWEMVTLSSILAWRIPWTEEPCGLQSTGLQKSQTWLNDWAGMHTQSLQTIPLRHFNFRRLRKANFEDKVWQNRAGSDCRNVFPFHSCMMLIFHLSLQTHFSFPPTAASLWCPVRLVSVYKHSDPLCQDEFICPQIDTTALLALWLMQLQQELTLFGRSWS